MKIIIILTVYLCSNMVGQESKHPLSKFGKVVTVKKIEQVGKEDVAVVDFTPTNLSKSSSNNLKGLVSRLKKMKKLKLIDMRNCFINDNEAYVFLHWLGSLPVTVYNDVEGSIWDLSDPKVVKYLRDIATPLLKKNKKTPFLFDKNPNFPK